MMAAPTDGYTDRLLAEMAGPLPQTPVAVTSGLADAPSTKHDTLAALILLLLICANNKFTTGT
jgi:hypothetical protein